MYTGEKLGKDSLEASPFHIFCVTNKQKGTGEKREEARRVKSVLNTMGLLPA